MIDIWNNKLVFRKKKHENICFQSLWRLMLTKFAGTLLLYVTRFLILKAYNSLFLVSLLNYTFVTKNKAKTHTFLFKVWYQWNEKDKFLNATFITCIKKIYSYLSLKRHDVQIKM